MNTNDYNTIVKKLKGFSVESVNPKKFTSDKSNGQDSRPAETIVSGPSRQAGSSPNAPKPLKVFTLPEFLGEEIPARKMLLGPIIPEQGLVMLYAERGIGKTFVALDMGCAVATGGSSLKWKAPEAHPVLYIDGEMPARVIQERLSKIAKSYPPECAAKLKNFRLITSDYCKPEDGGVPDLSTPEGQQRVEAQLDGVKLIILDNLSTLCRNGRENEVDSWLAIQEWLLTLRRRGIAVLIVHHAGKSGSQRGTSKREDVLDTIIELRHPYDYSQQEGCRIEIHFVKARGFMGEDAVPFEAKLEERDGGHFWVVKLLEDTQLRTVARLAEDGLTQRDIVKETGMSLGAVNRHVQKAKKEGLIRESKK